MFALRKKSTRNEEKKKKFNPSTQSAQVFQEVTEILPEIMEQIIEHIHDIATLRTMSQIPELRRIVQSIVLTVCVRSDHEIKGLRIDKSIINARLSADVVDVNVRRFTDPSNEITPEFLNVCFSSSKYKLVVFEMHWAQEYSQYRPAVDKLANRNPTAIVSALIEEYCQQRTPRCDIHMQTHIVLPPSFNTPESRFSNKGLVIFRETMVTDIVPSSIHMEESKVLTMTANREFQVTRESPHDLHGTVTFFNPKIPAPELIDNWVETLMPPELRRTVRRQNPLDEEREVDGRRLVPVPETVTFHLKEGLLHVKDQLQNPEMDGNLRLIAISTNYRISTEFITRMSPLPRKPIFGFSIPYVTSKILLFHMLSAFTIPRMWISYCVLKLSLAFPYIQYHALNFLTLGLYHHYVDRVVLIRLKRADMGVTYCQKLFLFNVLKHLHPQEYRVLSERIQLLEKDYRSCLRLHSNNEDTAAILKLNQDVQKRRILLKLTIWEAIHPPPTDLVESTLVTFLEKYFALVNDSDTSISEGYKSFIFLLGLLLPWFWSKSMLFSKIFLVLSTRVGHPIKYPKGIKVNVKLEGTPLEEVIEKDFKQTDFIYEKLRRGE